MKRQRGASLAEVMIACTLFVFCFTTIFVLFNRGRDALKSADTAGGLQSSLLRLKLSFQSDLQLTNIDSLSIQPHATLTERDSFSCVTLDDWSNPNNFSAQYVGPVWNRRVVYVNGVEGDANLDRLTYEPFDREFLKSMEVLPVWPLDPRDEVFVKRRVSSNVSKLRVQTDTNEKLVTVYASLKEQDERTVTGTFVFSPRNTRDYI